MPISWPSSCIGLVSRFGGCLMTNPTHVVVVSKDQGALARPLGNASTIHLDEGLSENWLMFRETPTDHKSKEELKWL